MLMRSELLVRIFEAFAAAGNTRPRTVRRLYCESIQASTKAYGYANFAAKHMIERHAIPKCGNCRYGKIQVRTMVMVLEELARVGRTDLLAEAYGRMVGISRKAHPLCNQRTQEAIRRLGLQQARVTQKRRQQQPQKQKGKNKSP